MYGKMQESGLTFHIHLGYLGPASCFFGAHRREWLQPERGWMVGVVLLPGCPGRLELMMILTSLFIDTAGNTPFLSWDFPRVLEVKNSPANAGDGGSILDPGRSHMPQGN